MKILLPKTAEFIIYYLAKKLHERACVVICLNNINDYYDINLKYGRLNELGINKKEIEDNKLITSEIYPKHKFVKMDLSDIKSSYEF